MKEKNSATSVPTSTPDLTVPVPVPVPVPVSGPVSGPVPIIVSTPKIMRPFVESPELIKMNQEILALRQQIENLTKQLDIALIAELPSIRNEKKKLIDEHTALNEAKINFVKIHFPENPIYALAIPQTLKNGLQVSTAGKQAKMDNIKENGISFNHSAGATGLDPSVPRGLFGINEMGDRGIYFSTERPAYLCDDYPIALGCKLTTDVSGVSIMPISSLITSGFKEEEINRGFDQLQKEFNFLQNDGTYPSNTEIVFMKNDQFLKMYQEYYINNIGRVEVGPVKGLVHNSWQ